MGRTSILEMAFTSALGYTTLGFYNIKSGSGIYEAVTDRPIDY